jgi:hypothetical protein
MKSGVAEALVAALCCAGVANMSAQPEEGRAASTVSVYQSLAADAIVQLCSQLQPPDSLRVLIAVEPSGTYWFIEEAISRALRERKIQPVPDGGDWRLECGVKDAHVQYSNVRREGLLGARVVDRTTALALWLRVSDRQPARFLLDQEWRSQRTDTINVSDVDHVEHPGVAATHAVVPSEGFFTSWLEPLILVGAIGVAVFLLFTTRS